jgi:putative transposon-encoded protein
MDNREKSKGSSPENGEAAMTSEEQRRKAKFEVYGEEMIEKEVKQSGNSGRVYLPPEWVGKNVKIIRID